MRIPGAPRAYLLLVPFAIVHCTRVVETRDPNGARTLTAHHVHSPIRLDGALDEPDWSRAEDTGPLGDTMSGAAPGSRNSLGHVKVLWDETALYVAFAVADTDLIDVGNGTDPHLWEQDCAEVMLDPDGDARNYFEIQVSPGNHLFDTRYDSPRQPRPFGDLAWSSGVQAGVSADGTLNQSSDSDTGYVAEFAIPIARLNGTAVPKNGDHWRVNFYLMDARRGLIGAGQRFSGWSPPRVGDFHVPARFGTITFAP